MTFEISPTALENDEVVLTTDANGDLAIQNRANGNTLTVDEDISLSAKADNDGGGTASLSNYASVDADSVSVTNGLSAGSVDTDELRHVHAETNEHTSDKRPLISTTSRTLYVDPATGDDTTPTEDVTQSSPLATLQEALDRTPHLLQHEWVIDLSTVPSLPVTYDAHPSSNVGPSSMHMGWAISGDNSLFRIHGDTATPSNVVVDTANLSLNLQNPEIEDPGAGANIHGLQLTGSVQCKGGQMGVADCIFTGGRKDVGIGGKNANFYVQSCEFQSNLRKASDVAHQQRVIFDNCSGEVLDYIATVRSGGEVVDKGNNTIRGQEGSYSLDSGGSVIRDGTRMTKGPVLADDFGDGQLTRNRVSMNSDPSSAGAGGYRPRWNANQGSPTNQNNKLRLPAGDTTNQSVIRTQPYLTATHSFSFQPAATPSGGILYYRFAYQGSSDTWMVLVGSNGDVYLRKRDSNGNTDIITGTWGADANQHTVDVDRVSGGDWELIVDNVSEGTATDTYVPSVSNDDRDLFITNTMDVAIDLDNIQTNPN